MLGQMQDNGMRGQMFSREELLKQMEEMGMDEHDLDEQEEKDRLEQLAIQSEKSKDEL